MDPVPPPKRFPSELQRDDEYFMWLAYNEAIDAWREDEVPVGAVAVRQGEVIASAHNQVIGMADPTAHAEILAITQAARIIGDWRLNQVTLYVTKEPCPMCSGATIMARIGRVVYGAGDPKMGFLGGATDVRQLGAVNHRPEVVAGVLVEECQDLLRAFFAVKREKSPPLVDESGLNGENGGSLSNI